MIKFNKFNLPDWFGSQVLIDEVNRIDLVEMKHVVEELGGVLELVVTERTRSGSDHVKRIGYNVTVELILPLGVDERFDVVGRLAVEPRLHLIDELLQSGVEVERLAVHQTVHLADPAEQSVDPSYAVVPPGDPLVEEDNNVDRITLSRYRAFGHIPGELEILVQEYRL